MAQAEFPAGGVLSAGGLMLCVTGKAPATITSVTPVRPSGGFVVQEWGVRPNPWQTGTGNGLGAERKPLSAFPSFRHQQVTGQCESSEPASELGVQVSKPRDDTATANGLRVTYRIGDRTGSFVLPYTIILCSPSDHAGYCSTAPSNPPVPTEASSPTFRG